MQARELGEARAGILQRFLGKAVKKACFSITTKISHIMCNSGHGTIESESPAESTEA